MIPMTTQHLGGQPGRARLGAAVRCRQLRLMTPVSMMCRDQRHVDVRGGMCARSWRPEALAPATTGISVAAHATAANGYVGTANPTGNGFRSIKRTARHLGTRTT